MKQNKHKPQFSPDGQLLNKDKDIITMCLAAPDMLEALENMISVYSEISQLKETHAMRKAKNAIKKARGGK